MCRVHSGEGELRFPRQWMLRSPRPDNSRHVDGEPLSLFPSVSPSVSPFLLPEEGRDLARSSPPWGGLNGVKSAQLGIPRV